VPSSGVLPPGASLAPFDALAAEARIVGLGEATHGSRELNDLRLALVKRLVERHGYRLIALEASASRWRELDGYASGAEAASADREPETGWIGVRAQGELLEWVRRWNLAHPRDRVRVVGVDPQDSRRARRRLDAFLEQAYGAEFAAAWAPASAELAAADDQTAVFGNSDVSEPARRQVLEAFARLRIDAPLLAERFGEAAAAEALATAGDLVQFADFNGGLVTPSRSRDWYMAVNLLAAMRYAAPSPKTIYWAHNAHVSASPTRWGPTGAVLRQAAGCSYRAVATTFGEGAFVAQVPDDPANRLLVSTLGPAAEETIENVLAGIGAGARYAAWECGARAAQPPPWLREPRPMRWVGGIYAPDTPSSGSYRPYRLTEAFDAVAYIPAVTAEDLPADRRPVPPRPRGERRSQ
jgi:erythromycin esterase